MWLNNKYVLHYFVICNIAFAKMTSSDINNINADEWVKWIEDGISREYINYHDYDEFQNIQQIGFGGFSKVYRATLESSSTVVAIKSFENNNFVMKEIVNEVNKLCLHNVDYFLIGFLNN